MRTALTLAIVVLGLLLAGAVLLAAGARAQYAPQSSRDGSWSTYHSQGSSWSTSTGSGAYEGQEATTYHSPGSSWSETEVRGPNGRTATCTTYHSPGSSFSDTTCR